MKAYILSFHDGVVQIGHTVYTVPLGPASTFTADRKGLSDLPVVEVQENSFEAAKSALHKYAAELE